MFFCVSRIVAYTIAYSQATPYTCSQSCRCHQLCVWALMWLANEPICIQNHCRPFVVKLVFVSPKWSNRVREGKGLGDAGWSLMWLLRLFRGLLAYMCVCVCVRAVRVSTFRQLYYIRHHCTLKAIMRLSTPKPPNKGIYIYIYETQYVTKLTYSHKVRTFTPSNTSLPPPVTPRVSPFNRHISGWWVGWLQLEEVVEWERLTI